MLIPASPFDAILTLLDNDCTTYLLPGVGEFPYEKDLGPGLSVPVCAQPTRSVEVYSDLQENSIPVIGFGIKWHKMAYA